ncbi:MAG: TraB/GumN family protein [Kofleriaceae bacterium]
MRSLLLVMLLACGNKPAETKSDPVQAPVVVVTKSDKPDPWAGLAVPVKAAPVPGAVLTLTEKMELANQVCPAVTGPFFFTLTKAGHTAHILGTRHISVGLAKFPPVVGDTLDHASQIVFEISPDDTSNGVHKKEKLKQLLGDADWHHYEELVGPDTAAGLEVGEPDVAAISMLVLYEDITNTLESQLQKRAREHGIQMTGLETSAFQDGVLSKLLDVRMLKATIESTKDRAELQKQSGDDLREYCAGTDDSPGMDADDRAKMIKAGYTEAELDSYDDILVYKRNADWIPKLDKIFLAKDNVFVAVGADHLIGPRGVIELMKKQGWEATRISK